MPTDRNDPPFISEGIVWAWAPITFDSGYVEPHLVQDTAWAQEYHPGPRIVIDAWHYVEPSDEHD